MSQSQAARTFKLTIAYDGTAYAGWQRQDRTQGRRAAAPTVQAALEDALQRVTGRRVAVAASGRTDSGVHALAQVAHVRLATRLTSPVLLRAINSQLPADIVVRDVRRAGARFHARFSARRKRYRYRWHIAPAPQPLTRHCVHHVHPPLDVAAMRRASRALLGRHDFKPFQAAGSSVTDTVRRVTRMTWRRHGEELWWEIEADGFLYKMVRRIAGTLLAVGRGQRSSGCVRTILSTGDARLVGPTAPARGLALVEVTY